jgi:hypothetical protein
MEPRLWNDSLDREDYKAHDKYYALIFEQYKTYLELAEKADTRAATLDTFFLTINTAALAFIATVWPKADANFIYPSKWWLVMPLVVLMGIWICYSWIYIPRSYRTLSVARWKVVSAL